ncbi:MAG: flagellar motor protein MotB [Thermodesulfobacteriota bacterium]
MASKSSQPIIIKRRKHGGHSAHGGSWKVAYADFVTAMMAFFLLMWLVSTSTPQTKESLATYFTEFDLFKGSASLLEGQGGKAPLDLAPGSAPPGREVRGKVKPDAKPEQVEKPEMTPEEIESQLTEVVNLKLGGMKDQVSVDRAPDGVRIQLRYTEGRPIFETGQTGLTETGREALLVLGQAIAGLPNRVVIEGHTDSTPLNRGGLNNWDLSAGRALAAMHYLTDSGMAADKVVRVAGLEATQPLIPENPADPHNRRISILLLDLPPKPGEDAKETLPPAPVFKIGDQAPESPAPAPAPATHGPALDH